MKSYITWIAAALLITAVSCGDESSNSENDVANDSSANSQHHEAALPDTVNMPRLVSQANDGSITLTAETGKGIGPDIKYMPEWRAFGWFTAADSVEWEIDVNTAGNYDVHLEWSVSDEEAGKEFILRANNKELTGTVEKSGSWETFKTKNIGRVQLETGRQKIVFKSKTKFDKGAILDLKGIKLEKV